MAATWEDIEAKLGMRIAEYSMTEEEKGRYEELKAARDADGEHYIGLLLYQDAAPDGTHEYRGIIVCPEAGRGCLTSDAEVDEFLALRLKHRGYLTCMQFKADLEAVRP